VLIITRLSSSVRGVLLNRRKTEIYASKKEKMTKMKGLKEKKMEKEKMEKEKMEKKKMMMMEKKKDGWIVISIKEKG